MKLSTLPVFVLIFTTTFSMLACDKTPNKRHVIHGSWKIAKKNVPIGDINQVMLFLPGDLYVDIGEKSELWIEADDNVLPYVVTRESKGILDIISLRGFNIHGQIIISPFYYGIYFGDEQKKKKGTEGEDAPQIQRTKSSNIVTRVYPRSRIKYYLTVNNLKNISALSNNRVDISELTGDKIIFENLSSDFIAGIVRGKEVLINPEWREFFSLPKDAPLPEHGRSYIDNRRLWRDSPKSGMKIESLFAENLNIQIKNNLNVEVHDGEVQIQEISISSAGNYIAPGVKSFETNVFMKGSVSATLNVSKKLDVHFGSHSGNVYYSGDPEITASYEDKAEETGKLIKIEE